MPSRTLGLNLQWGFTGMMNVGVVGFFGVGAYAAGLLTGPDYPDSLGGLGLPTRHRLSRRHAGVGYRRLRRRPPDNSAAA